MLVRKLSETDDMTYGQGRSNFINQSSAIAQSVYTRLRLLRGEWFLDTDAGVPYLQDIMVKPVNLSLAESAIKQAIIATDGIKELRTFELLFDQETRQATIHATVTTDFDDVQNITVKL